ncbi:unnamed protein product [Trifolium pratense]|uniref:Uncharacterized protein n=1 Tax=Trifolium pratense TaxID=57577 RepID=A0ACB0J2G0_TRIPR|nr:unnamed protein product [Trifolium pratense]
MAREKSDKTLILSLIAVAFFLPFLHHQNFQSFTISSHFKLGFVSLELGTCKEITPLKMTESLARLWVVWMARTS